MMNEREILSQIQALNIDQVEEFNDFRAEYETLMMEYRCAIMEVETKLNVLNSEFAMSHNRNPIQTIKSRLKQPKSLLAKLKRKHLNVTMKDIEENISDIAGVRIICSFPEDIYAIADLLLHQDDIRMIEIKDYIIKEFGYDLSRTCDEIRPTYHHVESCQETVPEAITAFLEGTSFEDVIRTAVSLGGDCDTLTCIAGSIAEAFYGVPDIDKLECRGRLPEEMLAVLDRFEEATNRKEYGFLDGTVLKEAMKMFNNDRTEKNLYTLLAILRDSFVWVPCNAILSEADYAEVEKAVKEAGDNLDSLIGKDFTNKDFVRLVPDILQNGDDFFFPVFATAEDMGEYGEHFSKVQKHFLECMVLARNNEKGVKGIVVNAFSEPFVLTVDLFDATARISSRFANAEVESDE